MAYQAERLPSGLLRYGAPSGQHDDTVMALAMAWSAVSSQHRIIYPMPDSAIVVQDFPIPDHWPRAYGLDVRWLTVAAIWGARSAIGCIVSVQRILRGRRVGRPCGWHPFARRVDSRPDRRQANGRNQVDGSRLIQMYRGLGLALQTIDNPLESGVLNLWERMNSGRLKVFASLTRYLDQRRLYRRDDKDQIVKEHDNLQDATRCLVSGIARLHSKPVTREHIPPRQYTGERSWMS